MKSASYLKFLKTTITIFLFSCLPTLNFGQTLYELNYHFETDNGVEHYSAFLNTYEDGTGLIRIAFTDIATNQKNIVEYEVYSMYDDTVNVENATQFMFFCANPIQILGEVSYPADHFLFEKNPQTGYFEPSVVISYEEGSEEEEYGNFEGVRLLNDVDLTEQFVGQFFVPEDEEYQNLFINEVRPITVEQKATKLHLIVVANTLDKSIGKTCVIDKDNVTSLFEEITNFLGIGLSTQIIEGKNFSRKNVDIAISKVKPGANDIVVFYYTGHGYNDVESGSAYPNLDLRERVSDDIGGLNTLNIEGIYRLIQAKNARFNMVLSDCCNNDPFSSNNIGAEGASLRTSSVGWNKNFCSELFLQSKQSILMTGASKGQLSAGNVADGGFFTFNLRENIEKSIGKLATSNVVNWKTIVEQTQKQTAVRANKSLCRMPDEQVARCAQRPVYLLGKM